MHARVPVCARDNFFIYAGILQYGVFYFISNEELYALHITNGNNNSVVSLSPINRDGANLNVSNPFLPQNEGSGIMDDISPESTGSKYVYTVHHHHAYIAVGHDVIELLLNSDTPNYHRLSVGHSPIQLIARDFGDETYLYVLYEENNRGYVAAYRKYSNKNWRKYRQQDLLVYSPEQFDLSRMSNILFFNADDWHYSYKVTYVAVGVGYRIYFKEILDEFNFNVNIPKPCDEIISINFNEIKQTLFVVCSNVTFYFSYVDYQIYESSLWNRTGQTHFSKDGRIAAIATNHSGDMTTVTVHGLHFEEVEIKEEKVYEFQHFHHVASRSLIVQGEFVTVSNTLHYFCYIEALEFGILCINVEQALMNVRNEGILNGVTTILPNTHSVICSSYADCPVMYSHHDLFVVQAQVCERQDCERLVMLFNMSTQENIANISGVSLDMYAYKAHQIPILISQPVNYTITVTQPKPTHTIPPPSSTPLPTQTPHFTFPTTDSFATSPPDESTSSPTAVTDNKETQDILESCQNDLVATNTSYDELLYITITLCVCFSVAMMVTIILLVLMICFGKREKSGVCKDCKK